MYTSSALRAEVWNRISQFYQPCKRVLHVGKIRRGLLLSVGRKKQAFKSKLGFVSPREPWRISLSNSDHKLYRSIRIKHFGQESIHVPHDMAFVWSCDSLRCNTTLTIRAFEVTPKRLQYLSCLFLSA